MTMPNRAWQVMIIKETDRLARNITRLFYVMTSLCAKHEREQCIVALNLIKKHRVCCSGEPECSLSRWRRMVYAYTGNIVQTKDNVSRMLNRQKILIISNKLTSNKRDIYMNTFTWLHLDWFVVGNYFHFQHFLCSAIQLHFTDTKHYWPSWMFLTQTLCLLSLRIFSKYTPAKPLEQQATSTATSPTTWEPGVSWSFSGVEAESVGHCKSHGNINHPYTYIMAYVYTHKQKMAMQTHTDQCQSCTVCKYKHIHKHSKNGILNYLTFRLKVSVNMTECFPWGQLIKHGWHRRLTDLHKCNPSHEDEQR